MKTKNLTVSFNKGISIENFVVTNDWNILINLIEMGKKLDIRAFGIENLSVKKIEQLLEEKLESGIYTLREIHGKLFKKNYTLKQQLIEFKKHILEDKNKILIFSRRTFNESSISKLKSQLGKNRLNYEIIAVESNDSSILKWAVHDRRIDYLSIKINQNLNYVDLALCSLVKQYQKYIEIQLSPLLNASNTKELNGLIRQSKKLTELLLTKKVPFVLTMGTSNPFHLRTALQLRSLARIIGIPFSKSKKAVGEYQLCNLLINTKKLHPSFIYKGVYLEEE